MQPSVEDVKVEAEEFFPMDTEQGNYVILNFDIVF